MTTVAKPPTLTNCVPILATHDVTEAIAFYRDRLGFEKRWTWGEPATFGCVAMGSCELFFSCQPQLAANIEGHQQMLWCDDVNAMHERHRAAGVEIVSAIENKPWGVREYTVRDLTGYHLRFAGPADYERPASATDQLPTHIKLEVRTATLEEYRTLLTAVGWNADPQTMPAALAHALFCVMAIDTRSGAAVGMLRVCGDGRYYTIWDVMVLPDYRGQKIGTAMMQSALARLRETGPQGGFVGLFTGKGAFYERLGFKADSGGMHLIL